MTAEQYWSLYIGIGFFVWLIVSILRHNYFSNATAWSFIKGYLFGVLLWPVAVVVVAYQALQSSAKTRLWLARQKHELAAKLFRRRYLRTAVTVGWNYRIPDKYAKILDRYGYQSNDFGTTYSKSFCAKRGYCFNIDLALDKNGWWLWTGSGDDCLERYYSFKDVLRVITAAELTIFKYTHMY